MRDPSTQRQYLNGLWDFAPAEPGASQPAPPSRWDATPIQVPSYWNTFPETRGGDWDGYDNFGYPREWRDARAAWYRTRFQVDPSRVYPGGRIRLAFDAVAGASRVVLNGRELDVNHDPFLPFAFDVTDVIRSKGDNDLYVFVDEPQREGELWLQPPGSWVGWHLRGIWRDVYVECVPGCFIDDVFVQTSVARRQLVADVTVRNQTDQPWSGHVQAIVMDGSNPVGSLERDPLRVDPHGSETIRLTGPWPDPELWSPERPKLYHIVARLDDEGGHPRHTVSTRFGFREFEIRGTDFFLNGQRIRLFGDSWHYMGAAQQNEAYARTWYQLVKELEGNAVRLHAMPHPTCYLDAADEMGILILDESAVYGSAGSLALNDDRFWARARDHVRRLVRRDRNHPSVVLWSACNEVVWKGGADVFPKLLDLASEASKLDPTRPVSFDENDSDLGGEAAIHSGHYGTAAHWDASWRRTKPLMVNEFGSLYHGGPNESSPYVGDAGYADFGRRWAGAGEEAADMFWKLRTLGAASITPWNVNWYSMIPIPSGPIELAPQDVSGPGVKVQRIGSHSLTINYGYDPTVPAWLPNPAFAPIREAYHRQTFYLEHQPYQWFGDTTVTLDAVIFNDRVAPATLELRWSLHVGGATSDRGTVPVALHGHAKTEQAIRLRVPAVLAPTDATLQVELVSTDSPEAVFTRDYDVTVSPRIRMTGNPTIAVVGGTAPQSELLAGLGCTVVEVCDGEVPAAASALVLAGGAAPGDQREGGSTRGLAAWIESPGVKALLERGGTVLVLPSSTATDASDVMAPLSRSYSRAFVRVPDHPILAGLRDGDFRDWPPDGTVARQVYVRPTSGEAWPLLDVGDAADGMGYTPLLLVPRANGCVVLSGLDLLGRTGDVPAAATLLSRILEYTYPPTERTPVCVWGRRGNAPNSVTEVLDTCELELSEDGAGRERLGPPDRAGVWMCQADDLEIARDLVRDKPAVDSFVGRGGTLLLCNVCPETATPVASLLEASIDVQPETRYNVAIADASPLLAGLNNYDFCWVERGEKCPIASHTLRVNARECRTLVHTVATQWEDYQTAAEQHKAGLMIRRIESFDGPRAVVVEIPRSRGRILISQLRWSEAREPFDGRAARILSQLLTNLGVARTKDLFGLGPRDEPMIDRQGYIRRWLVLGGFPAPEANPIDAAFIEENNIQPKAGEPAAGRAWREAAFAWPQVDLRAVLAEQAGHHSAAYAAVYVHSRQDRSVLLDTPESASLLIGSDDGAKVRLNGKEIGRFDYVRPLVLDQNRMDNVPLKKGWNLLLIKVAQSTGNWQFAARFVTASGGPVAGLKYALVPGAD